MTELACIVLASWVFVYGVAVSNPGHRVRLGLPILVSMALAIAVLAR